MLDEAERSLHDALCVLSQTVQDARVVYGGGFPEMQMAKVSHCPVKSRESLSRVSATKIPDGLHAPKSKHARDLDSPLVIS